MNIAVVYHTIISGGETNVNPEFALGLCQHQLWAMQQSGLLDAADEFIVGVNGSDLDGLLVAQLCGNKAKVTVHGKDSRSEIPTLNLLRAWLPGHDGWAVLYHHIKGVMHPNEKLYRDWRNCMERVCVWNWRSCVQLLMKGKDSVGCHWLTPEEHPGPIKIPIWGGNYWWATSDFLKRLPPLPEATWANRYEAEAWIGKGSPRARVQDFHHVWPGLACA